MTAETTTATRKMLSPKDEVRALLDRLPDDVTLEDIQYRLDVVVKVLEAEASIERGEGIPHEEVKRRFEGKWREAGLDRSEGFTQQDFDRRFGKRLAD
jgi:hypothetical protein